MTFEGHNGNITGVGFHHEGKWMVTSSEDWSIRVWDTRTAAQQRKYECAGPVNDVVIHPNQGELISADRTGTVSIWDLGKSKRAHSITPCFEDVSMGSVTVASDGSLLAAANNRVRPLLCSKRVTLTHLQGDVWMWRMVQDQEKEETMLYPCRVFRAHKDIITRILLSPDSRFLATCSADHTVRIWKIDPNERYLEPEEGEDSGTQTPLQADFPAQASLTSAMMSYQLSSDGQPIPDLIANRGTVKVIATRKPLPLETTLEQHQRWVWDCAFSADSAYLVTVSSDHKARLWELGSSNIIREYSGHHRGAVCVALNDYSEPQERVR